MYFLSNSTFVLLAYLFIILQFITYAAQFGSMMEKIKIRGNKTPRINIHPRNQKLQCKNVPKGSLRIIVLDYMVHKKDTYRI